MKVLRKIVTKKQARCLQGMGIPVGTTLHVIKESPTAKEGVTIPSLARKILVVRVDNGTGHLDLMHETAVCEDDIIEVENETIPKETHP